MLHTININNKYWEEKRKNDFESFPKQFCNYKELTSKQIKWLYVKLFIKKCITINFDKFIDRILYLMLGVAVGAVAYHMRVQSIIDNIK